MDIRVSNQPVHLTNKSSFTGSVFEIIFLVVIIIVGYFYLVSPKRTEYNTVSEQLHKLEQQQKNLETQKTAFDNLVQELASDPQRVSALDATLPLDTKPSRLYVLLENIIQSTGLTTGSVTVDADSQVIVSGSKQSDGKAFDAEHRVKPTNISISGTGTIDQLTTLLNFAETNTRLLEVNNLDVGQGRGDQIIFKIGLKAYSYTPEGEPR